MTVVHWLVVLSICMSIFGCYSYIRDTVTGKSKPNRVSWSMWAVGPIVGTFAALAAHGDPWVTARVFMGGFLPLLVFLASFLNPKSYWKLTIFDVLCGVCSVLALIIWIGVDSPRTAIVLSAIGDAFATLPTLRKAWAHPETETGITYVFGAIAFLLVVPSVPAWNIENSAFLMYLFVSNVALLLAVYRKRLGFGR